MGKFKLLIFASLLLIPALCFAEGKGVVAVKDSTTEVFPWEIIFPAGTITDNGDGTATYTPGAGAAHDPLTIDTNVDDLLTLTTQALSYKTQVKNKVFASPSTGADAVPAFRTLVDDDIPNDITITEADPTVNTSGEIQAIIGAGVYDASGAAAGVTPTTLSLVIGTNTQAYDADLTTYAGITPSANAQTLLGETFAQMQASMSIDDLITLSGVAEGSVNLATFTGTTIADNVTNKAALQALETAVEGKAATAQTFYIGTTQVAINRASAALTLAGLTLTTPDIGAATMSGNLTVGENGIILDPAISADGKYSGITEAGVAGAALAFGDLVYLNNDDSRWELVGANVADGYDKKLGLCVLAANADGDATTLLLYGKINAATAFPAITVGAPCYISETAGDITFTAPTTTDAATRIVGQGVATDEILFNPESSYYTHT